MYIHLEVILPSYYSSSLLQAIITQLVVILNKGLYTVGWHRKWDFLILPIVP